MITYFPPRETKQMIQTNRSTILGNMWSSFGLDLTSNLGVIRVAPRLKLNTSGMSGCPVAFKYFGGEYYAIAGSRIYRNSNGQPETGFSLDTATGVPTDFSSDESDMEVFNGTLVATTTDELVSSTGSAWTSRDTLNSGTPHLVAYFKKFDRLYYTNQSDNIISIDTSWATADPGSDYAISLSSDSAAYTITALKFNSTSGWIGILDRTKEGASGKILEWDGLTVDYKEYPLSAQGCLAIAIDPERDVPYIIDSNGVLLRYTGSGFTEAGRLPISTNKLLFAMNDVDNERFIHPNGMTFTWYGTIQVVVKSTNNDGTNNENFASGIYEFIPRSDNPGMFSCVHRYPATYATSSTITDYGQLRVSRVGAITTARPYSTSARNGTLLAGFTYYTDATTTTSAIEYDDSFNVLTKCGYFVTTWVHSQSLKDTWNKVVPRYRKLLSSSDRIVLKYRTTESDPSSDLTITWYNGGTIFKTSESLSGWAVGDEVEVVQGKGSGKCAHITSINDLGGGVSEVELDETFDGVTNTDTSKIRIQKWVKISQDINDQISESNDSMEIGVVSERIQLKCWMQFTGDDELFELALVSGEDTPIVN